MKTQISNKLFTAVIAILAAIEIISWLGYVLSPLNTAVFFVIALAAFFLTWQKTEYGLYFILAELALGGKGYMFDFYGISIRMGLFAAILLAWVIKKIIRNLSYRQAGSKFEIKNSKFYLPYLLLTLAFIFGIINGLLNNQLASVYADANAWLFFLLLPVFYFAVQNQQTLINFLTVLGAAAAWLAGKTVLFLFLFSHHFLTVGDQVYKWLRDTGLGEITDMANGNFRIFFYSQIYCLIIALVLITFILLHEIKNKKIIFVLGFFVYLLGLAIIISQSRSFWAGGLAGLLGLLALLYIKFKFSLIRIAGVTLILSLMVVSQIFLIQLITGTLLNNRLDSLNEEPAGVSRLNQLKPLSEAIGQNPVFGYGFGKTLTYQSRDPRILSAHPDGQYTTYAFEWGYLDIWLKLGLIGLIGYLGWLAAMAWRGMSNIECHLSNAEFQDAKMKYRISNIECRVSNVKIGLLIGLFGLCAVNFFTPYLNHPLGIGYIMLCSVALAEVKRR